MQRKKKFAIYDYRDKVNRSMDTGNVITFEYDNKFKTITLKHKMYILYIYSTKIIQKITFLLRVSFGEHGWRADQQLRSLLQHLEAFLWFSDEELLSQCSWVSHWSTAESSVWLVQILELLCLLLLPGHWKTLELNPKVIILWLFLKFK